MLKYRVLKLVEWICAFNLCGVISVKALTISLFLFMLSACEPADSREFSSANSSVSTSNWKITQSVDKFDRPLPNSAHASFQGSFTAKNWASGAYFGILQVSSVITRFGDMHITMRRSSMPGDQEIPIKSADPYLVVVLRNDGTKILYNADPVGTSWVVRGQHPRGYDKSVSLIKILLDDMSDNVEFYIVGGSGGRTQEYRFSITPQDRAGLKEVLLGVGAI